ncbi:MAG: 23S rRNA (guanosine(2251)-2'-O)-methyltransferase RlmB [Clostridiales bacterium]|nr:23S rRNA (guanosine(2251)-2'-O)-methyltransferase RlmB [Clostridiales bacterium]
MIIEGKNVVLEALKNNITINKMFVQNNLTDNASNQIIKLAKSKGIRIDFVSKDMLDKKTSNRHQGFVCYTTEFEYCEVEDILNIAKQKSEDAFIVILDGIEDPHNFGAIIRTCECAGVHGIIIPEHRACAVNDTVLKTSAGAATNMLIARVGNINNTIEILKKQGIWVYCLETGGQEMTSQNLKGAIAVVVGSEGKGVSRLSRELCDATLSIKLKGSVNSLNASVATAVVVYEIVRQRG